MEPVPQSPIVPTGIMPGPNAGFLTALLRMLADVHSLFAFRINRVLPMDGSERMTGPFPLMEYVDGPPSTVPTASDYEGTLIYVSDGAAGQKLRFSDGSSWLNVA